MVPWMMGITNNGRWERWVSHRMALWAMGPQMMIPMDDMATYDGTVDDGAAGSGVVDDGFSDDDVANND